MFRKKKAEIKDDGPIPISEITRLGNSERFLKDKSVLFNNTVQIVDASSFLSSADEIFHGEIYRFESQSKTMTILDCGANLGLASIYFKRLYPEAKIIAFEPDPNICEAMRFNLASFGYNDVDVRNEAISTKDETIYFHLEGGHSGMIVEEKSRENVVPVKAARLKSVMQQFDEITFLKLDIEGHESSVVLDIADELSKVQFMFLEYHSFLDQPQILGDMLNIIKDAGMRFYIKESYNKRLPFINREIFLNMDLLVNIFCYRD